MEKWNLFGHSASKQDFSLSFPRTTWAQSPSFVPSNTLLKMTVLHIQTPVNIKVCYAYRKEPQHIVNLNLKSCSRYLDPADLNVSLGEKHNKKRSRTNRNFHSSLSDSINWTRYPCTNIPHSPRVLPLWSSGVSSGRCSLSRTDTQRYRACPRTPEPPHVCRRQTDAS